VVTKVANSEIDDPRRLDLLFNISAWRNGYFLGDDDSHHHYVRDSSFMTRQGLSAVLWGHPDLAHECFSLALPQLLEDLGPNGPEETEDTFVPMNDPQAEPGGSVSQKITWGWSAEMKANRWICVGLCRWVLENRHDEESFKNAGDCLYRWVKPAIEGCHVDTLSLCGYAPIFCAAKQYDRALEHFAAAPKFKPPRTPGMARTQRAMAYILCQHYAQGNWTDEQITKAWASFFPAIVFTKSHAHLSLGEKRVLWIKMRYWDVLPASSRPTAIQVYQQFLEDDVKNGPYC